MPTRRNPANACCRPSAALERLQCFGPIAGLIGEE